MTGDYDPEFKAHFRDTSSWRVPGTDLGANAVLDSRTFIYFGDVPIVDGQDWPPSDADFIAFIEDAPLPARARLATARQTNSQIDVFFVGVDGALYVSWVVDSGTWQGPLRVSRKNIAVPGSALATGHQSAEQLDVFFIGTDGALYVSWVVGGGVWQGPVRISRRGVASPGGYVAAHKQGANQLDVLYVGTDGKLTVQWVVGGGVWQGPVAVSPHSVAPPGADVCAFEQLPNQLTVAFVGNDEKLNVQWVVGGGIWQGPVAVSPHPVAPPGACLTAFRQLGTQTTVAFIGSDQKMNVQWVIGGGVWQGPVAVSPHPVAPPGAHITSVNQSANQWTVAYVGNSGELIVQWVEGGATWQGPVAVSRHEVAPAGGPISGIKQRNDLTTVLLAGRSDELQVAFVVGGGIWQGPVRINPPMVNMWPVLSSSGVYYPFTVREAQRTWQLPIGRTPTGAFAFDGRVFVFVVDSEGDNLVSALVQTRAPTEPIPLDVVFQLSHQIDGVDGQRFWQVAPCVVSKRQLPDLDVDGDQGAILIGHGASHLGHEPWGAFYLAWLPLTPGADPQLDTVRFYTGSGGANWSPREADADPLFTTKYGWASLSLCHVADKWVMLYHRAGGVPDIDTRNEPIVARIADTPWDLATSPEISVFDPVRDQALGHYMYRPGLPDPNNLQVRGGPLIGHPSFAYGPHILHAYTHADDAEIVLQYLVSTGWPYQVQLMRTTLAL